MSRFIDNINIQWEPGKVTDMWVEPGSAQEKVLGRSGQVKYTNPPEYFTLRGTRYKYGNHSIERTSGPQDGEVFRLACPVGPEGDLLGEWVWVCEQKPGEWVRVLIPAEMRDAPFVA